MPICCCSLSCSVVISTGRGELLNVLAARSTLMMSAYLVTAQKGCNCPPRPATPGRPCGRPPAPRAMIRSPCTRPGCQYGGGYRLCCGHRSAFRLVPGIIVGYGSSDMGCGHGSPKGCAVRQRTLTDDLTARLTGMVTFVTIVRVPGSVGFRPHIPSRLQ